MYCAADEAEQLPQPKKQNKEQKAAQTAQLARAREENTSAKTHVAFCRKV
mgnify:CR=1 FL=1